MHSLYRMELKPRSKLEGIFPNIIKIDQLMIFKMKKLFYAQIKVRHPHINISLSLVEKTIQSETEFHN